MNHSQRARRLLAGMTLDEKIAQLCAIWVEIQEDGSVRSRGGGVMGIEGNSQDPKVIMAKGIGQITRPLGTRPIEARACVHGLNAIQKFLVEQTRLGIPAIPHEECLAGLMAQGATAFPAGINFGSLWDEDLMRKIASAISGELASVGSKQGLSPVLDVARDARWGRTEETMGEDPYLVGSIATAYIQGLQGPDRRVLATLKHFAGHSFSEGGRNHAPVRIGERELYDTFLLPFEMAVKLANVGSAMPAYHDIDGEPASSSRRLMTTILREKWGFDGLIVSDYEALNLLLKDHKVAADRAEAAAMALKAGMDMELPADTIYGKGVREALDKGILSISEVNATVIRILVEKSRLGLFENPYVDTGAVNLNSPETRAVAEEAALKSMVLLKNDGLLPLPPRADGASGKVALIGPLADETLAFYSAYAFSVHLISAMQKLDTPLPSSLTLKQAMEQRLGDKLLYARGCDVLVGRPTTGAVFPGDLDNQKKQRESYVSFDESKIEEAVAVAKKADTIVLAVGDLSGLFMGGTVGEGSDVSTLQLPGVQQKLVDAITAIGKPVALVLISGRPYQLGEISKLNSVLWTGLPGQEGAVAIAKTLLGDSNPGAKLPLSFPVSGGAMPYFYNHKLKSAGSPIQTEFGAIFPFGHGLSYTSFAYSDFAVEKNEVPGDGTIEVTCTVTNTGAREGEEVVQLYTRDLVASLVRPIKELKGFKRLRLAPGAAVQVRFSLPTDMLAFAHDISTRALEPGDFEVMIAASSADIKFKQKVRVTGRERVLPKNWRMQCVAEVCVK